MVVGNKLFRLAWRTLSGGIKNSLEDISIGKKPSNRTAYDFLAGRLDEIHIYNRTLTQDEITQLYQEYFF
jgi:hypothetical protein